MGTNLILSAILLAVLIFLYVESRLFVSVVRLLTTELADIKAFSMGMAKDESLVPETEPLFAPDFPDPDFGEGEFIEEGEVQEGTEVNED